MFSNGFDRDAQARPRRTTGTDMAGTQVSLGDGPPITVRALEKSELDGVVLRCWPDRKTLDRLFAEQGTIRMAAWDGDKNVAQLHSKVM